MSLAKLTCLPIHSNTSKMATTISHQMLYNKHLGVVNLRMSKAHVPFDWIVDFKFQIFFLLIRMSVYWGMSVSGIPSFLFWIDLSVQILCAFNHMSYDVCSKVQNSVFRFHSGPWLILKFRFCFGNFGYSAIISILKFRYYSLSK